MWANKSRSWFERLPEMRRKTLLFCVTVQARWVTQGMLHPDNQQFHRTNSQTQLMLSHSITRYVQIRLLGMAKTNANLEHLDVSSH